MSKLSSLLGVVLAIGLVVSCVEQETPLTPVSSVTSDEASENVAKASRIYVSILSVPGIVEGDASVAPVDIGCDEATDVAIDLISQNSIQENPADVMLVLDRSGSMNGSPLNNLKNAANTFVDIIDEASDGVLNGVIDGSRVGVVSFATSATLDRSLMNNATSLKTAINALSAFGRTAAGDGMNLAQAQLAGSNPGSLKIMIVVSDGESNEGANPNTAAANARAAGTEIFAIGFGAIDAASINAWATDPDATHAFFSPSSDQLEQTFQDIGADIVRPGGSNITLQATVSGHFAVSNESVNKGSLGLVGNVLTWTISSLETETVTLSFTATHDPTQPGGVEAVVSSISYMDDEGNTPTFPALNVNVRGCPASIDLEPDTDENELYPGQEHTVIATVSDDFGDPVEGVSVGFEIVSGPNAGTTDSGDTDSNGEVAMTYSAAQGLAGLGTDQIKGCFTNGGGDLVCDTVTKEWVDTTPPDVACPEGFNPAGYVPQAHNEDGFYLLQATDLVDPNPQIFVDAGKGVIFGPFPSGTNIKYTEAPGIKPRIQPGPGEVDWQIIGCQDLTVFAVDASGNQSDPIQCLVPPPPSRPGDLSLGS